MAIRRAEALTLEHHEARERETETPPGRAERTPQIPAGADETSARELAGLDEASSGRVIIGDTDLGALDEDGRALVRLEPLERKIAVGEAVDRRRYSEEDSGGE